MIITDEKKQIVEGSDFHTIKSKVNSSKLAKLYGLLSNIYKNPIGSIVREYSSNAYDANKEAYIFGKGTYDEVKAKYPWIEDENYGIDRNEFIQLQNNLLRVKENEPIVVGISEKMNRLQFFVKDFGIGLSPDRMNNIFFDYLSSTKEDTDDEIGGFGIGAKSALSIFKQFYIDTVYNGIQYQYMMGKDEKGIPEGTLLHQGEYDSNLENGTKISMYIENSQIEPFIREMQNQLAYLNNVYFDFSDVENNRSYYYEIGYTLRSKINVINDFKIYDFGKWYRRDTPPLSEMHMSIGNICYPIDWNELQVNRVEEPFALKFNIGDLQPTPSRESIMYSDKAKTLIRERIQEIKDYYLKKINDANEDTNDLDLFLKRFNEDISIIKEGDVTISIEKLFGDDYDNIAVNKIDYIPFKNASFKLPAHFKLSKILECDNKLSVSNARKKEYKYSYNSPTFSRYNKYFLAVEDGDKSKIGSSFRKNAYIMEEVFNSYHDIPIYNIDDSQIQSYCGYYVPGKDIKIIEANIKLFKDTFIPYLKQFAINYDAYEPTPTWHLKYEAGKSKYSSAKKKRNTGTISALTLSQRYDDWHRNTIKLEDLNRYKGIVIYGTSDDKHKMEAVSSFLRTDAKIKTNCNTYTYNLYKHCIITLCVSKENFKILKEMDNTKTIDEAVLEIKTFRRILTARKIKDRFEDLQFLNKITYMNDVLKEHFDKVQDFMNNVDYHADFSDGTRFDFVEDAMKVAETHNLFDVDILNSLSFLEKYAEGIELVKYLNINSDFVANAQKDLSSYLMTEKKKRIKPEYYPNVL